MSEESLDNMNTPEQENSDTGPLIAHSIYTNRNLLGMDPYASRVDITFPRRRSIYYSVTDSEINIYAQLGWFSTIFLTFFGVLIGVASGAWIAIQQGDLSPTTMEKMKFLTWTTIVISVIFLVLSVIFIFLQVKSKKAWESIE